MSQDNLIMLECTVCKNINYHSKKNKKITPKRLELQKYCKHCRAKTLHKETKEPWLFRRTIGQPVVFAWRSCRRSVRTDAA